MQEVFSLCISGPSCLWAGRGDAVVKCKASLSAVRPGLGLFFSFFFNSLILLLYSCGAFARHCSMD